MTKPSLPIIFMDSPPVSESNYPGLNPRTYTLKAGSVHREGGRPLTCDILVEQDAAVTLRDGVTLRADIYRPTHAGQVPAIMAWSPYGKRNSCLSMDFFPNRMDVPVDGEDGLNTFEGPNPSYWVEHGYAVIAVDSRGAYQSEGDLHIWGEQEARDISDTLQWAGTRTWCTGKIALTGNSWLAMSQWFAAALRPPYLAAIAPWEGASDIYRDVACVGGIPGADFSRAIFSKLYGNNRTEDLAAMTLKYPLFNTYWASKVPDFENIEVPAYIVASWTNLLHSAGTFRGWERTGSSNKWLRVHDHFEWPDYYKPENVEDLRRFFDRFLKDCDNNWEATPRVRLTVLNPGHDAIVNRAERSFPLARQVLTRYYLNKTGNDQTLTSVSPTTQSFTAYNSDRKEGTSFFVTFDQDTEITGYIKLRLWVESTSDDMDIFAFIRKHDADGNIREARVVTGTTHIGPNGRLRASLRATDPARSTKNRPFHTFDNPEKLAPGEIVPVDIAFWPYAQRWQKGETLELRISSVSLLVRPDFPDMSTTGETINRGDHVIHFGGQYDSHLLLPIIPNC